MIGRNDPCSCNSGLKYKKCCLKAELTTALDDVKGMRAACKLAANLLSTLDNLIKPGISTLQINDYIENLTQQFGAVSAPLGYVIRPGVPPFPKSICTSVNNVVCHGIPSAEEILQDGDIINCDITVKLNGYHGDTSKTFLVGNVKPEAKLLVERTYQAMMHGIDIIAPDVPINLIGAVIEDYITPFGYGIVRELTGHGVNKVFHDWPAIYHCRQRDYNPGSFKQGMTLTIEPMLNLGSEEVVELADKWTVVTKDGSLSAQFEHTILVTSTGYEILTLPD